MSSQPYVPHQPEPARPPPAQRRRRRPRPRAAHSLADAVDAPEFVPENAPLPGPAIATQPDGGNSQYHNPAAPPASSERRPRGNKPRARRRGQQSSGSEPLQPTGGDPRETDTMMELERIERTFEFTGQPRTLSTTTFEISNPGPVHGNTPNRVFVPGTGNIDFTPISGQVLPPTRPLPNSSRHSFRRGLGNNPNRHFQPNSHYVPPPPPDSDDDDPQNTNYNNGRVPRRTFRPGLSVPAPSTAGPSTASPATDEPLNAPDTAPPRFFVTDEPQPEESALAARIHYEIKSFKYDCGICFGLVTSKSKVWSCQLCWGVFHFKCVQEWRDRLLTSTLSPQPTNQEILDTHGRHRRADDGMERVDAETMRVAQYENLWRCPGCNLTHNTTPLPRCWCGKEPGKSTPGMIPNSCGQTCSRYRECKHKCMTVCHAGPCPPCPVREWTLCACQKEEKAIKCDEKFESCHQICGKQLECKHECKKECHGTCPPCEEPVEVKCHCGDSSRTVPCFERGSFSCEKVCETPFDCGAHKCKEVCHEHLPSALCPRSPAVLDYCPCGKTRSTRTACTDPDPPCSFRCEKDLPCSHSCQEPCHSGSCPPCGKRVTIFCRCGRVSANTNCHNGEEVVSPMCPSICYTTKSCGKHTCLERCCVDKSAAIARERQSKRRKGPVDFEDEHICAQQCGAKLGCGHVCQVLCHKGRCPPCPEGVHQDYFCPCGNTGIPAPYPCGTPTPECTYPCKQPTGCEHKIKHTCHPATEPCPKCPFLVVKKCACEKEVRRVPCSFGKVRCLQSCLETLSCGHSCLKKCHRLPDEPCEEPGERCKQPCGRQRKECGHAHSSICHEGECPEKCMEMTKVTCLCGNLNQIVACSLKSTINLTCTEACDREARKRQLASAFVPTAGMTSNNPYSARTMSLYVSNPSWCSLQESRLLSFIAMDGGESCLRFEPMNPLKREFLHLLSSDYGLKTESTDRGGLRAIVVYRRVGKLEPLPITLAEAAKLPRPAAKAGALASSSSSSSAGPAVPGALTTTAGTTGILRLQVPKANPAKKPPGIVGAFDGREGRWGAVKNLFELLDDEGGGSGRRKKSRSRSRKKKAGGGEGKVEGEGEIEIEKRDEEGDWEEVKKKKKEKKGKEKAEEVAEDWEVEADKLIQAEGVDEEKKGEEKGSDNEEYELVSGAEREESANEEDETEKEKDYEVIEQSEKEDEGGVKLVPAPVLAKSAVKAEAREESGQQQPGEGQGCIGQ